MRDGGNPWIQDSVDPRTRAWEEFYRNRWQHDRVVRSTHGVNCTGSCSWNIHVKDGIVTWEMQALDYPSLSGEAPGYEPRGCQRGISYSWYLYSPLRVKYPYVRGALLDLWRDAKRRHEDPVDAWKSLVSDPEKRARWQRARGKGGFRRTTWDEALDIVSASAVHTVKDHGPDRVAGFSPIPAMSMLSYAAGARFLQLMGGVNLSFYDWYCDLPNASPETWGEQTDVNESADWFNAKFIAVMGANLNMTRTPDVHFAAEARHNGSKLVVFSPDFSQVSKYADEWVPLNAGQDGAWWMAVNHVILKEFHHEKKTKFFFDYVRDFSDAAYLIELVPAADGGRRPGKMLRANRLDAYAAEELGDWKFLQWDKGEDRPKMPQGSVGHRWQKKKGQWNTLPKDGKDGSPIDAELSFLERHDDAPLVEFDDFADGGVVRRAVPARKIRTKDGDVLVATAYDLLMATYGVDRGLKGDYPRSYDEDRVYTPAWAEKYTGVDRKNLIKFAREWASTAEKTGGKCTVIVGAGVNHWYHANLMYRAAIHGLVFCGCVGVNGGGLAHYVGQEKLAPMESWSALSFAKDWGVVPRLQNAPSWHYVHSDQWRYERSFREYHPAPSDQPQGTLAEGHTIDVNVRAVKNGWLPFYPQFDANPLDVVKEAEARGAKDEAGVAARIVERLKSKDLKFAIEKPDAESSWPRLWFIWRGNALMASAKGHEYFLSHYLGTHTNSVAKDLAEGSTKEIEWLAKAPTGKLDLVVDLNFRMDTSALYSDVVLPAATWYEKADLNSTDMHSFIHPLAAAVPPCWESKSDWDAFKAVAERFSKLAERHLPGKTKDVVATPLAHDTAAEVAQPSIKDWAKGEVEAVPGRTMPGFKLVEREYAKTYEKFCAFGPKVKDTGLGAHGTWYPVADVYDDLVKKGPTSNASGVRCPSVADATDAANLVLGLATVTNGELAHRSYRDLEEKTGVPLVDLAADTRATRFDYRDLQTQPRRLINSPMWSGLLDHGRAYAPFTFQRERRVPWRTLTGRQHLYLDHEGYLQYGEHLPTYKPRPTSDQYHDLDVTGNGPGDAPTLRLNYLTPHGKWHIHSTYGDNQRMSTLSRGCDPFWMNDHDAAEIGIVDNDWVEVHNDHGVVVTRAAVTARIPRGVCIIYHSPERTYGVPKSPLRGDRRAGGHNSLTRTRLKPNLMVGGYGQFTFHFNYWGPTGCNRDTHVLVRKLSRLSW